MLCTMYLFYAHGKQKAPNIHCTLGTFSVNHREVKSCLATLVKLSAQLLTMDT